MARIFKRGELARFVTNNEVRRLTAYSLFYGSVAIISAGGDISYLNPADPPYNLADEEQALVIKASGLLTISYLCATNHRNSQDSYAVHTRPITYQSSKNGKKPDKVLRCKLSVKFNLTRNSSELCEAVYRIMSGLGKERLSKKDFLKSLGRKFEEDVVELIAQPFTAEVYQPDSPVGSREIALIRTSAEQKLSGEFAANGLQFSNAILSIDNRSLLLRYTWPSFTHDSTIGLIVKFVPAPVATLVGVLLRFFGIISWP